MDIIDHIVTSTEQYIDQIPKSERKKYGQFFTSKETALFMSSMFSLENAGPIITVLDPGAGSGILTAAFIERLQTISSIRKVQIVCYESDQNILPLLKSNLEYISTHAAIAVNYEILDNNYITSQKLEYNSMLGATSNSLKVDYIIGNPPYMKIAKDAPEAAALQDVCHGAPNVYFLFAAMSLFNLKAEGELVYIIPRSWTSGAYFKKFRQKFLNTSALECIHLFIDRNKVFESEEVLQETMIIKARKSTRIPENIAITTTQSNADFSNIAEISVPYNLVVDKRDNFVYLVTSYEDIKTLTKIRKFSLTLPDIGLKMKTGLTVDFRTRDALRDNYEESAVPLFYSNHIKDGGIKFPIGREHEYIVTNQSSLLQKNSNYLFVKRFTSKEEHRRLQCGVYISKNFPKYKKISTQNKINFICGAKDLSENAVYGLYVLFNSSLYDSYYRILNGSTQVNSTEINSIPVPPLQIIEEMGNKLINKHDMSESTCDRILESYI